MIRKIIRLLLKIERFFKVIFLIIRGKGKIVIEVRNNEEKKKES